MEGYAINWIRVSIIVLQKSLRADVPYLDGFISWARGYTSSIRMESDTVNPAFMIIKAFNQWSLSNIPKSHTTIVWTWANQASVWRKLATADPVLMSWNWELEFSVSCIEHFQCLIVATREKKTTVLRESYTLNWSRVALNDLTWPFHTILP